MDSTPTGKVDGLEPVLREQVLGDFMLKDTPFLQPLEDTGFVCEMTFGTMPLEISKYPQVVEIPVMWVQIQTVKLCV